MGVEVTERIRKVREGYSKSRAQMTYEARQKEYPLGAEPALVHPNNHSVVKVRDNGMIEIFVGNDNGLRIDPEQRSITALSNVYKEKNQYSWQHSERNRTQSVGNDFVTNVGNDEVHNVSDTWTVHAGKNVNVISDGTIYMEAREKIHMKSPLIHLDATKPKDELDPFRPPLGLMFEEDSPYGREVPFGYRVHIGANPEEKRARYRREEYDDLHVDRYEVLPSMRGADKLRLDTDGEWLGPVLRERYDNGEVRITAAKTVGVYTKEKDAHIDIQTEGARSSISVGASGLVDIDGAEVKITPMPPHNHPEYQRRGE